MDQKQFLSRIRIVSFFIVFVSLLILIRLFSLQVIKGDAYEETADRLYIKSEDSFDRGSIFFSKVDGSRISAATINTSYILAINPSQLVNIEDVFEKLNGILKDLDKEDFLAKASKKADPYEEIREKIKKEDADAINNLNIKGVKLYKHKWRFYPGKEMAAHTIGFVGFGGGDYLTGQYGLEKYYNETLKKEEEDLYVNIFAEIFSGVKKVIFEGEEREGDVIMTLEPTVQNFLEKELQTIMERYDSEASSGIIINPQNGEIIALAHKPTFDLNNFEKEENVSVYSNPLVENIYEFGSVIKPLVIASAIEEGVISESTPFYDKGFIQVEDKTIYNFDKKGRGQITMQDVLSESLNTGMVFTMQKLGRSRFKQYMESFRLGEKTNIDLPNEAKGIITNLNEPRELEYATASFGQGISFSPMVLVRAWSALGNGGYLIRPHVVKKIEFHDVGEKEFEFLKEDQPQVFSAETSRAISKMMVYSVDNVYGNGKYKMENYSIAAKTGTAQIPNPEGGYYEDRNLHSFVGYFPAYDPEFLIFLSIRSPRGVRYAAETLSAPFFDITKFLISYYEVAPDR